MWESDVTVRWRSFTQGDAGMRQGWTQLLGQGGNVPSTEKPHWNQSRFLLGWLCSSQGCTCCQERGPGTLWPHTGLMALAQLQRPVQMTLQWPEQPGAGHSCKAVLAAQGHLQRDQGWESVEGVAALCPWPCSAPAPSLLLFLPLEGLWEGDTVVNARMESGPYTPHLSTFCSGAVC